MRDKSKIIALVALIVAVVGLGIGFAAFSSQIVIEGRVAVSPSADTFNVDFSSSSTSLVSGNVTPTTSSDDVEATVAKIDNAAQDSIISNLSETFTEPGQSVTYTFYAYNAGKYTAYLKNISFLTVQGETTSKICTPITGTTSSAVESACDGITLSISVGSKTITNLTDATITSHSLAQSKSEPVVVTIAFSGSTTYEDGDFYVEFGDITLSYSTVD